MEKNGVMRRDGHTNTVEQIISDISFKEAYSAVWNLRANRDGNIYWIGILSKDKK